MATIGVSHRDAIDLIRAIADCSDRIDDYRRQHSTDSYRFNNQNYGR